MKLGLYERRQERIKNRPLKALCFLIEQLALRIASARWIDPTHATEPLGREAATWILDRWRTDPFRFSAFKIAVGSLLSALEPEGKIVSPLAEYTRVDRAAQKIDRTLGNPVLITIMEQKFKSPENLAADTFSNLWARLTESYLFPMKKGGVGFVRKSDSWIKGMIMEETYALDSARSDLGLDKSEDNK